MTDAKANSRATEAAGVRSRVALELPRPGALWLTATGGLLLLGLYKGINLLALLAWLMAALMLVNGWLAGRRLGRLQPERRLAGPIFAQTPFTVELVVTNPHQRAQMGVLLQDRGPLHELRWFVPRLEGRTTLRRREEMTLPTRGRWVWGAFRASSGYPFGLVQRARVLQPPEEVVVLPRLGRLHRGRLRQYLAPVTLMGMQSRQRSARHHPAAQTEFHGLRAYRSGDSPRWIHWRTSARRRELMVREFEELPSDNLVLVVDAWKAEGKAPPSPGVPAADVPPLLEEVLSLAATICWEWSRQKGDRLLLALAGASPTVLDGMTSPEYTQQLLSALALENGHEGTGQAALLEQLAGVPLPAAPVLVISNRQSDLAETLARRLRRPVASIDVTALAALDFYESPWSGASER